MSTETTDARKQAYREELQIEYRRLSQALDDVNTARVTDGDGVTSADLAALERSVMSMRTQMLPLIDGQRLFGLWDQFDLDRVPVECAIEQTYQRQNADTGQTIQKTRTMHAPLDRLELFAEGLMRIYCELGFAPRRDQSEKQTKIDADLLKEVDEWRRQNVE